MTESPATRWIAEAVRGVEVPGSLDDLATALTQRHRKTLRLRRDTSLDRLPIQCDPVPWYSLGYQPLDDTPKPSRLWSFVTGDFYLQDAGSLLALATANADGERWKQGLVCDLCALPGGKASALLEALGGGSSDHPGGFLLANEAVRSRLGALQWNLARTGSDRYAISNQDPDHLAKRLPGTFDLVLVDAPCSGQALVGRGKQNLSALSSKQIQHSAARQQRILDAAARLLRPGGTLVYSTCTFSLAENEAQIGRLTSSAPFRPVDHDQLRAYRSDPGCYRLWPHRDHCAGSFAASLISESESTVAQDSSATRENSRRGKQSARISVDVSEHFDLDGSWRLHQTDSTIIGWPADAPRWVEQIAVSGPELLHRTGQTWKPSHAAALRRVSPWRTDISIELDEPGAQAFMRSEPIDSPKQGWHIVRYRNRPLGWAKGNGTRAKNHLPAAARVQGAPLL